MSESLDGLFPAIGQVFVVIGLGYVFGRLKIIRPEESKSLGAFVGKLALPSLLFLSMANINLSDIDWYFLGGVLLAKFGVFVLVAIFTFILKRPFNPGYAGLYAIVATTSNDLALGLPILQAIYTTYEDGEAKHIIGPNGFDYVNYIYLLAPMSVIVLIPIGFVLMETGKQIAQSKADSSRKKKREGKRHILWRITRKTFTGVVLNPVVFMTILGIIVNVIIVYGINKGVSSTEGNLPFWLSNFLKLLGGAFAPLALFSLGMSLVGKLKHIGGNVLVVALLLVAMKSIFLPFVAALILKGFGEHDNIVTFGFQYGIIPTAPSVFVFSSSYEIGTAITASAMVLGTFVSAPLMYTSARVAVISMVNQTDYREIVYQTEVDVSTFSIVGCVIVFLLFMMARHYKSRLHVVVLHMIAAQMLINIGTFGILGTSNDEGWRLFSFSLYMIGLLSYKLWSAWIIILYFINQTWGSKVAEWFWIPFMTSAWGLPALGAVSLAVVCGLQVSVSHTEHINATLLLGNPQLILESLVTIPSLVLSVLFLTINGILAARKRKKQLANVNDETISKSTPLSSTVASSEEHKPMSPESPSLNDSDEIDISENAPLVSNTTKRTGNLDRFDGMKLDESQNMRLTILFLILIASLIFSAVFSLWIVSHNDVVNGIYMFVTILAIVITHGQGFFILTIFGLQKHWFIMYLVGKLRSLFYAIEEVSLPSHDDLDPENRVICNTFKQEHLDVSQKELESVKRYHLQKYNNVFTGAELVDWLLIRNLVATRQEGVSYGNALLLGRVIEHVHNEHYFHDASFFYQFTGVSETDGLEEGHTSSPNGNLISE